MRTLVVDDEFVALTKLTTLLSEYGKCDAATNGAQAFELFNKAVTHFQQYDLITIDIEIPEINGLELLKKICSVEKAMKVIPSKKIIISAEGTSDNIFRASQNQCDAFLVKPITKDVIKAKLIEFELIDED